MKLQSRKTSQQQKATTKTGKLVWIKWLDHCSWEANSWHDIEDTAELIPIEVTSVGYIIKETKKHIVIAATITDGGSTNGEMCIIKGCIIKRKKL